MFKKMCFFLHIASTAQLFPNQVRVSKKKTVDDPFGVAGLHHLVIQRCIHGALRREN